MTVRQTLRHRFEPYRSEVSAIVTQVESGIDPESIDGYVDSGTDSDVFRLPSDPEIVAKLPYGESAGHRTRLESQYVQALVPGIERAGLEQIVAYSGLRRLPAVLSRYADGPTLRELDESARERISGTRFAGLIAIWQDMREVNLAPDWGTRNIIFPPDNITLIDYTLDPSKTLTDTAVEFAGADMLLEHGYYKDPVPGYGLLFRDVCADVLGGDTAAAIEATWQGQGFARF